MLVPFIFSCSRKQENSINQFDNIVNLSVSDSLFSDNELPMGTIMGMKSWKDILITCHNADDYRYSFIDSKTGKLIARWGQKGNAPNEFIDFGSDFYVQDSLLVFLSSMKKSINYVSIPAILRGEKEVLVKTEIYPYTADFRPLRIVPIGNRKVATGLFKHGVLGVLDENNNTIYYNKVVNDSVYVFSDQGGMQKCYYFKFNNRNVPDDEKQSYDKLVSSKGKEEYVYFNDCPMVLNNFIVGSVFQNGNKGTFLYDTEKDKGGIKEWRANKIELSDIILPITTTQNCVIGWMDYSVYEALSDKSVFSSELTQHLNDGGHVLVFYYLNNVQQL